MPAWPWAIPSHMAIVLNSMGSPPLKHALLDLLSQLAQRFVTGADLVPTVCNRNQRLVRILERINGNASGRQMSLGNRALKRLQLVYSTLHEGSPFFTSTTGGTEGAARLQSAVTSLHLFVLGSVGLDLLHGDLLFNHVPHSDEGNDQQRNDD